jgi:hypothetical protein
MLELGSSGSVRGVLSNEHPYREPGPIAAPDVSDGTSAVGESRHRIPRAHPLVNRLNFAPRLPIRRLPRPKLCQRLHSFDTCQDRLRRRWRLVRTGAAPDSGGGGIMHGAAPLTAPLDYLHQGRLPIASQVRSGVKYRRCTSRVAR